MTQQHITPEYAQLLAFLRQHPDPAAWGEQLPHVGPVRRVSAAAASDAELEALLTEGEGQPAVLTEGLSGWQAPSLWSFPYFLSQHASLGVRANDRAPARHADAMPGGGPPQRTATLSLGDFISDHVLALPPTLSEFLDAESQQLQPGLLQQQQQQQQQQGEGGRSAKAQHCTPPSTPFYLNGWRAFAEAPVLGLHCPPPAFAPALDHTRLLLQALDETLFGGKLGGVGGVSGTSIWVDSVDSSLTKCFMGPPGTITRMHFDAGGAHGWLAQVVGRKLFVLLPPSATQALCPLATERETQQSALDPLCPDLQAFPQYPALRPLACIVHPGEAILVPQNWWHYAVALDRSITVQRNFYHRENPQGLVQMVLKTVAGLRGRRGGGAAGA